MCAEIDPFQFKQGNKSNSHSPDFYCILASMMVRIFEGESRQIMENFNYLVLLVKEISEKGKETMYQ